MFLPNERLHFIFQIFFSETNFCFLRNIFTSSSGMSLSAGSSPLHSPKITPHTSPAPRRRSHTPNPANYLVPSSASTPVNNPVSQTPSSGQVIQKETVGGTTYFYTDTTPAPLTGMVRLHLKEKREGSYNSFLLMRLTRRFTQSCLSILWCEKVINFWLRW